MNSRILKRNNELISLHPVSYDNWRNVANLKVSEIQREFVAEPSYYLALCCYGGDWHPLAICLGEQVIGFMMWTTDPADVSCWLGGIIIDQRMQKRGFGEQSVKEAIRMLQRKHGYSDFALSYQPGNLAAKHLYTKLGFIEMNEWEDNEIVARLSLTE